MIRVIQFDSPVNMKIPAPMSFRALVEISYKGENKYRVRAMNIKTRKVEFDKMIEYTALQGNSRKNYSKLRDVALNAIESKPLGYSRNNEQ